MKIQGLIIIILMLLCLSLSAIEYYPAHSSITSPALRDSIISYHTFTDDQHWYGSNSWAVKFDFRTFHAFIDSFAAEGVMIYIPGNQSADPLEVIVCNDLGSQPDLENGIEFTEIIQPANINFHQWQIIDFQNVITDSILWVVVNYPTNTNSQYIGASAIDGMNSYYLYDDYYENMFASGFESEFLFSIYGTFYVTNVDLDLVDFHWNGALLPGERIYPVYTIRNTSDSIAYNVYIDLTLNAPAEVIDLHYFSSGAVCDSILLPDIEPHQMLTFDFTNEYYYDLLSIGSQYTFNTAVKCSLDVYNFNNSYSSKFQHFTDRQNTLLIENVVSIDDNSNNLLQVQSDLLENEDVEIINYYPGYTQVPFYCEDSYLRFNYYNLIGVPATIINGNRRIIGYSTTQYPNLFQDFFDDASVNDSTFVSDASIYGTYNEIGVVTLTHTLSNLNNKVFSGYLANCSIYGAVVEDVINHSSLPNDLNVPILRTIFSQTSAPTLGYGNSFEQVVQFNYLDDVELITGDINNCRIVFWLQDDITKRVYNVSDLPFGSLEMVDVQPNEIQTGKMNLSLYPNPYSFQGDMQISFSLKEPVQNSRLEIYNIRGQKVQELSSEEASTNHTYLWNGKDSSNKEVSTGIYFMKLIIEINGNRNSLYKKCLLLKK